MSRTRVIGIAVAGSCYRRAAVADASRAIRSRRSTSDAAAGPGASAARADQSPTVASGGTVTPAGDRHVLRASGRRLVRPGRREL